MEHSIKIPKFTLVQQAFAEWYVMLHEMSFEFCENPHPIWIGNALRHRIKILELKSKMTKEELAERIQTIIAEVDSEFDNDEKE